MNKTFLDLTERLLEKIEDIRLLKLADSRINDNSGTKVFGNLL